MTPSLMRRRKPNRRGSFSFKNGITLIPYQHYAIKSLWKVTFFHGKCLKKFNDTNDEEMKNHEDHFAVVADTYQEAVDAAINAYELRERQYEEWKQLQESQNQDESTEQDFETDGNEDFSTGTLPG